MDPVLLPAVYREETRIVGMQLTNIPSGAVLSSPVVTVETEEGDDTTPEAMKVGSAAFSGTDTITQLMDFDAGTGTGRGTYLVTFECDSDIGPEHIVRRARLVVLE